MLPRKLSALLIALTMAFAVTATPQKAEASAVLGEIYLAVVIGGSVVAGLELASIISSSVYLGMKKRQGIGWTITGSVADGLTILLGLGMMGSPEAGSIFLGIGALSLTLTILAATRNKPQKAALTLSPMLMRDTGGNIAPGLGVSLLSF